MKKNAGLIVLVAALAGTAASALFADEAAQASAGAATTFELKMRILEGSRDVPSQPANPVTASFLRFQNVVSFDTPEDVRVEEQIKKLYGLKDLSLVTQAPLVWQKGKTEKATHVFRLNGQQYLVTVTPGRLDEKVQKSAGALRGSVATVTMLLRIEVDEQAAGRTTNLLDTEFTLPDKNAAVFGFENTQGKPYFIVLRLGGWRGAARGLPPPPPVEGAAGKKVQGPKLVKTVDPAYPPEAKKAGVEGSVTLEATADTYGQVSNIKVLRSVPLLDRAAIDALKQWVYEPMVIDGKPRSVTFTVTMNFRLKDKEPQVSGVEGGVVGGVKGGVQGGVAGGVLAPGKDEQAKMLERFAAGAVRAEGEIQPPSLLKTSKVIYPEAARQAGVQGVVILGVKTDETGQVVDVVILRSVPLLDQAAIDAVRQWVYEPKIVDGKAASIVFTVTVRFELR